MSVRDRLRDLKARTKSRFNDALLSVVPSKSTGSATGTPGSTTPADTGNVPPTSPPINAPITPLSIAEAEAEAPSITATAEEPSIVAPPNRVAPGTAWANLRALPRALGPVAGAFGPLKVVVDELIGLVDTYERTANGQDEYAKVQGELELVCEDLRQHFSQPTTPLATAGVESLCKSIQRELDYIKGKQARGSTKKILEESRDPEEIIRCYHRIQTLLQRLSLNVNLSIWKLAEEQTMDTRSDRMSTKLDRLSPSLSARYNSAQALELKRGSCTPGTRVNVLSQIHSWTCAVGQGSVYWLNGMAGTGKTTIVYTLSAALDSERRLAASFFCSRLLPECRKVSLIIPSIAYQLARFSRPFQSALSQALEKDPDVHTSLLDVQFQTMIAGPLSIVRETLPENLVIVIDALDECDNKESTGKILDVLLTGAWNLPIKFIVSSRPESEIRDQMAQRILESSRLVLHELDKGEVRADVEIYLKEALAPMNPPESQITALVEKTGVLFIYAATVVRYVGYDNFRRNPRSRLETVLGTPSISGNNNHKEIDELYSVILKAALNDPDLDKSERDDMELVLHTIICAKEPLTISALTELLQLNDTDRVRAALRPLWSVLHVVGETELVTTLHASFPDYMFASTRSKEFHCDIQANSHTLAAFCFDGMRKARPQFNICGLETSYIPDIDIPGIEERVQKAISPSLFYACRYWAAHLHTSNRSIELDEQLEDFLTARLLLWLEVINLKRIKSAGPGIIQQAENWCTHYECSVDLKRQIRDAWRFTMTFTSNPLSCSTPHIYTSMLPFWPRANPVSQNYVRRTQGAIQIAGPAEALRGHALLGKWPIEGVIRTVDFSPDGTKLAVDVSDRVYILDAASGVKRYTLYASGEWLSEQVDDNDPIPIDTDRWAKRVKADHRIRAKYETTSEDFKRVAISSCGNTIAIYQLTQGQPLNSIILGTWDGDQLQDKQELTGHNERIASVVFSHDGVFVASGSADETVRVWSATRILESGPRVLYGHHGGVTSIDFSQDGTLLGSCSFDATIRIWNPHTGEELRKLDSPSVMSVSFSPNGNRIAAGLSNGAIQVWDTYNGKLVLGSPDWYYNNEGIRTTFSPDCSRIVSWSTSGGIRIWDAETEHVSHKLLQAHSGHTSVACSPDGVYIASASQDNTICVWNAKDGRMEFGPVPLPHSNTSIFQQPKLAFSPDSTRVLLRSDGNKIDSLNVKDGQATSSELKTSIVISTELELAADGKYAYASCIPPGLFSNIREYISIWDTETGEVRLKIDYVHTRAATTLLKLSPNNTRIAAVVDYSATIQIWNAQNGVKLLEIVNSGGQSISALAFSHDGARIAFASADGLCVWNAENGTLILGPIEIPDNEGSETIWPLIFSPDGNRILYGLVDTIMVRDAWSGRVLLGPLQEHTTYFTSLNFSSDGTRVVSGWDDGIIRVYDIDARTPNMMSPNDTTIVANWKMRRDGWVVDDESRLLVWVPHDLQKLLMGPRTTLLISGEGFLRLNFDGARIGEAWPQCYVPELEN